MLTIYTIPVTLYEQNARILYDNASKACVIVDPGGDVPKILSQIPSDAQLSAIWITHSHIDHVSGVGDLMKQFEDIAIIAHNDDAFNRENLALQSQMMQFPYAGDFQPTKTCKEGDILSVGEYDFNVLYTPGHALGHISFFCENNQLESPILIAGDALFKGSIGRTDLPGGNHQQLLGSIQNKLFSLPDNTIVLSGHGPNTTIGNEKDTNPFF